MSVKRTKHTTATNKKGRLTDVEFESSENVKRFSSFRDMGLKDTLVQSIASFGFTKPSIIQQKAIVPIIKGRDVIAQSQSGTGKTATFVIATLQRIDTTIKQAQVLCLVPTLELSTQIHSIFQELGEPMNVKSCSVKNDITELNCHHIVIATPHMAVKLINNNFETKHLQILILDEADLMLHISNKSRVYQVYRSLPKTIQVVLISATLTNEFMQDSNKFMTEPIRIFVKNNELSLKVIKQYFKESEQNMKFDFLHKIYSTLTITQSIIFCNTARSVDQLMSRMEDVNFAVAAVHGGTMQCERDRIFKSFQLGAHRILITTDIWSRGIDVHNISLVVNFDFPSSRELYIHRIGRTGRFGRKGIVINLLNKGEAVQKLKIEQHYNIKMDELPDNLNLINNS